MRDSLRCRRLIQSPWYQSHFGDRFCLTGDQNEKHRFENDSRGCRIASSVGGANTGEGGDRIVCDDLHNVREGESEAIRRGVCEWWDTVMPTRLNDPKTGAKVIIMRPIHAADLAGHILEQGGYEHLRLPAEYDGARRSTGIGWRDPREETGELLWPQQFGREQIDELKLRLGSYAAAGQLQQRPSPAEGGILKRKWWRYLSAQPKLATCDEMIQSWELAFKDRANSSYVVRQVWGRWNGEMTLLDQVRRSCRFPRRSISFGS